MMYRYAKKCWGNAIPLTITETLLTTIKSHLAQPGQFVVSITLPRPTYEAFLHELGLNEDVIATTIPVPEKNVTVDLSADLTYASFFIGDKEIKIIPKDQ